MKIIIIGYGYTQSLGNYENAKLYAEAEVTLDDGTDPAIAADKALDRLRSWVHWQLPEPALVQDLRAESRSIQEKIDQGIESLTRLRNTWDEAIALLEKHGITITEEFPWKPEAPEPPPEIPAFPLLEDEEIRYEDPDEDPDEYI